MDVEILRRAPLFATLDDEVFAALTDELTEVDLSRGASVFREGDQGDQLYFIVSGEEFKLGRATNDGRENLVAILGPGELFWRNGAVRPEPAHHLANAVSETRWPGRRTKTCAVCSCWPFRGFAYCCRPGPPASAAPTTRWPISSPPTFRAVLPRPCWTLADRFGRPATMASWWRTN